MVNHWIGISSIEIDSHCGEDGYHTLANALDGEDFWRHHETENHWFILDLGQTYTIRKVRGKSNIMGDPININIYVSDSKVDWGEAVATGVNYLNTDIWIETDTIAKNGRYIKLEIIATEYFYGEYERWLNFGSSWTRPFTIFDVYGDIVEPLTDLCLWIDDLGGPSGLIITDIFDIIDSYLFEIPPSGYTFVPTIQNVFGVIDYHLGFDGDANTGCDFFP